MIQDLFLFVVGCVDAYCEVEVDSFGHFFVKAKTKVVAATSEPTWNQVLTIFSNVHRMMMTGQKRNKLN